MTEGEKTMTDDHDDYSKRTVSDVLGQIVWLMTQSADHRGLFLSDLEWSVMPALLGKQFKIYHHEGQPKAAVFWAMVDEDTHARLKTTVNPKLRLSEWRSGTIPVVIDAIAPFGNREKLKAEFLKELEAELSGPGSAAA